MATVLQFDHDVLMSGRSLRKPINFALSRIVSPRGVEIDLRKRPVVVVDPRAGQGPGIIGAGDRTTFADASGLRGWRNCWRLLSQRVLRPGVQSRRAGR